MAIFILCYISQSQKICSNLVNTEYQVFGGPILVVANATAPIMNVGSNGILRNRVQEKRGSHLNSKGALQRKISKPEMKLKFGTKRVTVSMVTRVSAHRSDKLIRYKR